MAKEKQEDATAPKVEITEAQRIGAAWFDGECEMTQRKRVKVLRHHSFVDHNGRHREWRGGMILDDPAEVALLIERGAHIEVV